MDTCAGPLLRYDVPVDGDGDVPVALIECGSCGVFFVFTGTGNPLDERHRDTLATNGDPTGSRH